MPRHPGSDPYPSDVLAGRRRRAEIPRVTIEAGLVVEDVASGFCGAVIDWGRGPVGTTGTVTLADRHEHQRVFPITPAGFAIDGAPVSLVRPVSLGAGRPTRTASGSIAVPGAPARLAQASRIYVEGLHDAALVERVWGDDLRVEGVVVEPLHGVDDLPTVVTAFRPAPRRRLGVLVDHLVAGTKESRIVASVSDANVLVTGHPYVDIWQAVKPERLGIAGWPQVPRSQPWKEGVCAALGVADSQTMWRRVLAAVSSYTDLEQPLLRAVEELIDFVTAGR